MRVLAEFEDERRHLPGPLDGHERIEPVGVYMARRIPSAGLAVCYLIARDGAVVLVAVKAV